MPYVLKAGLLF